MSRTYRRKKGYRFWDKETPCVHKVWEIESDKFSGRWTFTTGRRYSENDNATRRCAQRNTIKRLMQKKDYNDASYVFHRSEQKLKDLTRIYD